MLTVLSVAFPLAAVTTDSAGGAEQVLAQLDRALVAAGHRSIVIAPAGSKVAGELVPTIAVESGITNTIRDAAQAAVRAAIAAVLAREPVDLLHLHGLDFASYLPAAGPPCVVTLHLPLDWYPPDALEPRAGRPSRPRLGRSGRPRAGEPGAARAHRQRHRCLGLSPTQWRS